MGQDTDEITHRQDTIELDEYEDLDTEMFLNEIVYKYESKKLDMSLLKPMDMSCNRSVFMPGPRSAIEEATLELRRKKWMKEADEFMKIHCDERGIQKERNLS